MQQSDHSPDYYRLREAQEREMAANARDEAARVIHLALAGRYRLLAGRRGDNSIAPPTARRSPRPDHP